MLKIKQSNSLKKGKNERGSAIVIAVFVLVLISVFVALALSRTASEAVAVGNETAEARTFYAAQGSLEMMTRNFNKVFETRLNPSDANLDAVRDGVEPGLTPQFSFDRDVEKITDSVVTIIPDKAYAGLYATRDTWRLNTVATDKNGVEVKLTRNILNNRIPIFQFGIFYDDDLELHPGPRFDFGGRVHSNGSIFLMADQGLYFSSRVTTAGEVITDIARNGDPASKWGDNVFIKNGTDIQLLENMGSVLKSPANGTAVFHNPATPKLYNPDMPVLYKSTNWRANAKHEDKFGGNLLSSQPALDLPLKISTSDNLNPLDYVELIKRGKSVGDLYNAGGTPTAPVINPVTAANADSEITVSERYQNKTGIRITLANSKARLPGCASGVGTASITGPCGVRLDGASTRPAVNSPWAEANADNSHGYQPLAMTDGYQATRLNGERFRTAAGEVWMKIELVSRDDVNALIVTKDVTEDILSLGVTEAAPCIPGKFEIKATPSYYSSCTTTAATPYIDSRSVIKLQRFAITGENFVGTDAISTAYMTNFTGWGSVYNSHSIVYEDCPVSSGACTSQDRFSPVEAVHKKVAVVNSVDNTKIRRVVPFPIEMFDSREGIYSADSGVLNTGTVYGSKVPWAGVMSLIDIDVANFRRFLNGDYDAAMPATTKYFSDTGHVLRNHPTDPTKNDVPQDSGWVVYVSDRRGDSDFDGEYDMEDIYGNNDGTLQKGENVNNSPTTNANGGLDTNYVNEAAKYTADGAFALPNASTPFTPTGSSSYVSAGYAAAVDHPYYRRGVRLINGEILPGKYDWANASNTRGFTVASENGVYVQGNYNARAITAVGTPTSADNYLPQGKVVVNGVVKLAGSADGANQIPASIVADVVTILSNYNSSSKNGWSDSRSFLYPFNHTGGKRKATETFTRFAMLSGDAKSSYSATPNQGGGNPRMGGGVHNFKRFLENWTDVRLNYAGSLINLYNARNNNGAFKIADTTYDPPTRNWIFDSSFLDPSRLPPGTPYFQYIQTTGFQRDNN